MNLELLMLGDATVSTLVERARLAERSGFNAVWLADERFYREVYTCLAIVAENTNKVQLGPCVTDPFVRHPALTAVAISTLDEISRGRAILGLGGGVSGFTELGIEAKKPPRAIRETIELVRALMSGEQVDYHGEIINFTDGHLGFKPVRPRIPMAVASNGPLGQRAAGALADIAIMEACGSVEEVRVFRAEVERGAEKAGRTLSEVTLTARLNCCIADDGRIARDAVRPTVARILGRGSMRFATAEQQGLTFSEEIRASVANAPYHLGVKPYLPLLPMVTDRQVDAFTLAGTPAEVTERVLELRQEGIKSIIIRPLAPPAGSVNETIERFGGEVMPAVAAAGCS